jgi:hypothetical protein
MEFRIVKAYWVVILLSGCGGPLLTPKPGNDIDAMRFSAQFAEGASIVQDAQLRDYLEKLLTKLAPDVNVNVAVVAGQSQGAVVLPDGGVILALSQFQNCTSEPELAFILLHEIAHLRLGHKSSSEHSRSYSEEVAADVWAIRRLVELRWNPYAVEALLEREAMRTGNSSVELLGRLDEIRKELSSIPVGRYYVRNSAEFVAQQRRIINGR